MRRHKQGLAVIVLVALLSPVNFVGIHAATSAKYAALSVNPLFFDDFEAAVIGASWQAESIDNGVAVLSTNYPHSGTQSMFLGQNVPGRATSSLILAINLAGQTDVFLDFWVRSVGSFTYYNNVAISDNGGGTWKTVLDLAGASQGFTHRLLDIGSLAAANGLTLNSQFRIRFTNSRSGGLAGEGLAIDDVRLTSSAQVLASFPFGPETFEGPGTQLGVYTEGLDNGVVTPSSNDAHSGAQSMFLGQDVFGRATSSLILVADLTGSSAVLLDFWSRSTGSAYYNDVSISDNHGATWRSILDLNGSPPIFRHHVVDISGAAAAYGLALNKRFRIRITSSRSGGEPGDGLLIDDLRLVRTSLSGKVYNDAAITGNEVAGAVVEVCSTTQQCQTVTTGSDGFYGFGELGAGAYTLRALPPAGSTRQIGVLGPISLSSNATLANQHIVLPRAIGIPAGTALTPTRGLIDGAPSIFWETPVTLSQQACAGGTVTYEISANGAVVRSGTMAEGPAGTFSATLAPFFPLHGAIQTQVNIRCPGGPQPPTRFTVWIDPSGLVLNTQGSPIDGATVSLYAADTAAGPFTLVASGSAVMSPSNRANPMTTNSAGAFGWDVVAGYYRVRAEKAGCTAPDRVKAYSESAVLTIPPPATDLRIVLFCGEQPNIFLPLVSR